MTRSEAIQRGALVTILLGAVAGLLVPMVGALAAVAAGGMATGVRSREGQPALNGVVATFPGALLAAYVGLLVIRLASGSSGSTRAPEVDPAWVLETAKAVTPTAVPVAVALAAVGGLAARYWTRRSGVHPALRDGT